MPRGDLRLSFLPPIRGLKTDAPPYIVEDGFIVDGENFIVRDTALRIRPGYAAFSQATGISNAIMGAIHYQTNSQLSRLFIVSLTKVAEWDGSSFTDRTGVDLTGTADDQVRLALFQTSTDSTIVGTNNQDAPFKLVAGSNKAALGGSPPTRAKDVTVCFQRVIFGNVVVGGTRGPSSLLISAANDPESYPAINLVDLSDTNDTIVAVRTLNTQTFAIYKDNSQWVGIGAQNVFPFTYELRSQAPGPVSPAAVVPAYGMHYYLGQDGNIYTFDGDQARAIGNVVQRTLQGDIDFSKSARVHGFFDRTNREIWWFYHSINNIPSATYPASGICYNLITQAFSTICRFPTQFSSSSEYKVQSAVSWDTLTGTWDTLEDTYATWDSFPAESTLVGALFSSDGGAFIFGQAENDDGASIDGNFTTPMRDLAGPGQKVRVDAIEPYWKQASSARTLSVVLLTSDTMATTGTAVTAQTFDTNVNERHVAKYSGSEARFVGVKQSIASGALSDEYRGMTWYIYRRSET